MPTPPVQPAVGHMLNIATFVFHPKGEFDISKEKKLAVPLFHMMIAVV